MTVTELCKAFVVLHVI